MPPSNGSSTTAADQAAAEKAAAEKAAADKAAAAEKAAVEKASAEKAAAKAPADDDDGLRPRRPAKVDKAKVKVLSKGKTAQVVTDGTHVWKEAIK